MGTNRRRSRGRPRSSDGYSLIELCVVTVVMAIVVASMFGALTSLTNSEARVHALVTNQETVRFGLDRLQRDLRAANPVDPSATTSAYGGAVQVELGPNPGTRTFIRWIYDRTVASPTYESLLRQVMSGPATNATVVSQVVVIPRVRNLELGKPVFAYYDAKGADLVANNPNTPANVANCAIRIHVQVNSDTQPGPQPFAENIDIELRNRLPGGIVGCG
jgi:type II secretory pathway pseudopilin PulG